MCCQGIQYIQYIQHKCLRYIVVRLTARFTVFHFKPLLDSTRREMTGNVGERDTQTRNIKVQGQWLDH